MGKINTDYGKVKEDKSIEYAPQTLKIDTQRILKPTEAMYLAQGWKRIIRGHQQIPLQKGFHWENTGKYKEWQTTITEEWIQVKDDAPQPRIFSKLKLYAALVQAGIWDALVAWLQTQEYQGINAYTAFSLAQELTDEHPMFKQWIEAAKTALGVSDEVTEQILSASIAD